MAGQDILDSVTDLADNALCSRFVKLADVFADILEVGQRRTALDNLDHGSSPKSA
jgi:hypothetical protein